MKGNVKIVHTKEKVTLIHSEGILFCRAEGSYTEIYLKDGRKEVVSMNLKNVENQIVEDVFYRIHRSYVVNVHEISSVYIRKSEVELSNGLVLPISRRGKTMLFSRLEVLSFA